MKITASNPDLIKRLIEWEVFEPGIEQFICSLAANALPTENSVKHVKNHALTLSKSATVMSFADRVEIFLNKKGKKSHQRPSKSFSRAVKITWDRTLARPVSIEKRAYLKANRRLKQNCRLFAREIGFLNELNHCPDVPKLDRFIQGEKICFYQELCSLDLLKLLRQVRRGKRKNPFDHSRLLLLCYTFFRGLQHIHSRGIVHADIKPSNLFLKEISCRGRSYFRAYLGDFGFSYRLNESKGMGGTFFYLSPQKLLATLRRVTTDKIDGFASDMWSAGLVLHELYYGYHPYLAVLKQALPIYKEWRNCLRTPQQTVGFDFQIQRNLMKQAMQLHLIKILREMKNAAKKVEPDSKEFIPNLIWNLLQYDPEKRGSASTLLIKVFGELKNHAPSFPSGCDGLDVLLQDFRDS